MLLLECNVLNANRMQIIDTMLLILINYSHDLQKIDDFLLRRF